MLLRERDQIGAGTGAGRPQSYPNPTPIPSHPTPREGHAVTHPSSLGTTGGPKLGSSSQGEATQEHPKKPHPKNPTPKIHPKFPPTPNPAGSAFPGHRSLLLHFPIPSLVWKGGAPSPDSPPNPRGEGPQPMGIFLFPPSHVFPGKKLGTSLGGLRQGDTPHPHFHGKRLGAASPSELGFLGSGKGACARQG